MALSSVAELLINARKGSYSVGAFNANNMEIIQAIVRAAEMERAPVILQASQGAISYAGLDYITGMVKIAAEASTVPIALHLDHGTDFGELMRCIRVGFSSVMYDGSKLPLEENIAMTRKVIEIARPIGVSVEAELGKIGGTEDHITVSDQEAMYTSVEEAEYFVKETGVDSLAIAIGTAHGQYKGEPKLDFERLAAIRKVVDVPIVLHGSSGVPDDAIRKAVELGVCKVNIDTNIREAFVWKMREVIAANPSEIDPRKILGPARDAARDLIAEKIRLFGSSGKA